MVSRMCITRVWIRQSLWPSASSRSRVLRRRMRLAVDAEDAVAGLVLDPVVVADRDQLLPHLVAHRRASPPEHLALVVPLAQTPLVVSSGRRAPRNGSILTGQRPVASSTEGEVGRRSTTSCRSVGERGRVGARFADWGAQSGRDARVSWCAVSSMRKPTLSPTWMWATWPSSMWPRIWLTSNQSSPRVVAATREMAPRMASSTLVGEEPTTSMTR